MAAGTAAVQAVYTHDFVSTFDILKPDVWASLIRARGKQGAEFFSTITSLGFKVPTSNEDYSHFEDDWIHETIEVSNAVAITYAAAPGDPFSFVVANLDAQNQFYVREKDDILLKDGTLCYVTNIDTTNPLQPVVTAVPHNGTIQVSLVTQIDVLDEIGISSNANDEGTGQPKGRFSGTRKYENSLQIIKETLEVTGTQMTDGLWFNEVKIPGENGTKITAYMAKGQQDTEYRLALAMEGALLFGEKNTNAQMLDPETGKPVRTTEGLIPYMTTYGNEINYTPGSWTIAKFNEMNKVADKEHAPSHYCGFLGIDLHTEIEDAFVDYLKETNVSFCNDMMGGSKEKEVNIGFTYLHKTGRNYAFKRMHSFSNQKTYGASDYDYPAWGLFIPLGMNKTTDSYSGSSKKLPTVGVRYKQLGKYNRFTEVWDVSGAGTGRKVIDLDKSNLYMRAHIGGHNQVGNQMIKVNP